MIAIDHDTKFISQEAYLWNARIPGVFRMAFESSKSQIRRQTSIKAENCCYAEPPKGIPNCLRGYYSGNSDTTVKPEKNLPITGMNICAEQSVHSFYDRHRQLPIACEILL